MVIEVEHDTMMTQTEIVASLPRHLRPFAAAQDYDLYTPRDHAVWRFLLNQLKHNLSKSAHPTYLEGLAKTGIGLDAIPRIEEINACLNKIGWRAVVVDGFLPPAVFMEFQAIKVLVIAVNIRSFEHMLYTPAPDIVHESAGHAPFLIDIDYAEFLQRFGELGMRAVANQHDIDVYEAVRQLSIVKERSGATNAEIAHAEAELNRLAALQVKPSEATLLARLHWWTVEYGLVGNTDDYSIFGAGLLSSLAESESCLDDSKVKKWPLTINSINTTYDITESQPQLFVTESCRHLSQVLEEYGRHMCCYRGGASALQEACEAGSVNTITLNSGLQIAGRLSRVMCDAVGNAVYFNTEGSTQLAYQNTELAGHSIDYHAQGFGSPVGKLRTMERCLSEYTVDELKRHHIEIGKVCELHFLSGITVTGELTQILRKDQRNILFSFEQCAAFDVDGTVLFDPDWGTYDMAVGNKIESVSGGSADQKTFPLFEAPSNKVTLKQDYDAETAHQFELYQRVRDCRDGKSKQFENIAKDVLAVADCDWLLLFETWELGLKHSSGSKLTAALFERLQEIVDKSASEDTTVLIQHGLSRLSE